MVTSFVISVFSLAVAVMAPFVAYPLAEIVKAGRSAIDGMINWRGANAETFETVEDGLTYLASFIVSVLVCLAVGAVYVWYVQTVTFPYVPWLSAWAWGNFGVIGSEELGYYNTVIAIYWSAVYVIAFLCGWLRAGARR